MMAENLSNFTVNSEKLTRFKKVRGIFSASKQRIQAIFTTVAVNFKQYFYTNGRNLMQYLQ
jgi:phosphotransferase system IIB component